MDNMRNIIEEIKTKLKDYQALRKRLDEPEKQERFSCLAYLDPPIPMKDIELFEAAAGVRLPEGLRLFLSEVGSGANEGWRGGIGPHYGIISVKLKGGVCTVKNDYSLVDIIAEPFPFTQEYNLPEREELYASWEIWHQEYDAVFPYFSLSPEGTVVYLKHSQEDIDAYLKEHGYGGQAEYYDRMPDTGIMPICGIGCGEYYFVVLTGLAAGEVWIDHRDNWGGYSPVLNEHEEHMDFASWYLQWLEGALKELSAV